MLSPSWAGPGVYPNVHERSLAVLREQLGLQVVEFPTTRDVTASPADRARDIMAAFVDPSVGAVLASIGGDDQLTVLGHLDPEVLAASPKRFFGYSDNTNLLNYLWNLGIVSYHGGSTMVHLARAGGPHRVSLDSLRAALFTSDTVALAPLHEFSDLSPEWSDPHGLDVATDTTPEPGWTWAGPASVVSGPSWGGNLEIWHWNLAVTRWIRPPSAYEGCVLVLETSEEMPSAQEVARMLRNAGERGLLEVVSAVIVGKPKAWSHEHPLGPAQRERYREDQRTAVLDSLARYAPAAVVVIGPDIGHTDPQVIVPYGGLVCVDGVRRTITMTY